MDAHGRRVLLGRIVGVSGVQGWIKLESWTDPREGIFDYSPWVLVRQGHGAVEEREIVPLDGRAQGKGIVARLPGVEDREQARQWVGFDIFVPRAALPPPGPDEFYWIDLEGLAVQTVDGVDLGRVSHLFETGSNDVLVVRGARERLIPFLRPDVVRSIDFDRGSITVDWDPDF